MRFLIIVLLVTFILLFSCKGRREKTVPVYEKKITDTVQVILRKAHSERSVNHKAALGGYLEAISQAKELKDDAGLVAAYRNAVFTSGVLMKAYDRALALSDDAIAFARQSGDANTLCDMYSMRALVFQVKGDMDSATVVYKTALKYMEEDAAPDPVKNWPLYLNMADLYSAQGNQSIAIEYTNMYLEKYALKIKDTGRMVTAYNNLSAYYTRLGDTASANRNILKSYYWMRHMPAHMNADAVYSNMLNMYNTKKMYDSALFFCRKRLELNRNLQDSTGIAISYSSMMETAWESKNKTLAQQVLDEHNPYTFLASDAQLPLQDRKPLFDGYYRMYRLLGDDKNAYFFLRSAYESSSSLRKMELNKELEKYELERKKVMQENVILSKQLQLNRKNTTILLLIATSLLLVMTSGGVLLWYRRRLDAHHRKIELLEKEGEWNKTKAMLEGQLEERNRISRELHDDLGTSLTSIALASGMAKSKSNMADEEMDLISSSAQNMIDTLNEIVWSLNSRNDSLFGLIAYIRKFASGFLDKAGIRLEVQENLPVQDRTVSSKSRRAVYLTAKEAFNNIVKHSSATKAYLYVQANDDKLTLIIRDNGKGMGQESRNGGGGNGIANMQKNMAMVNGSCIINEENGVTVTITSTI
ncbi:histidine kinase [Agriterribacter sp.]|uniref:tetratricopeptide repeat-containing sensor histidine kinase n=1 Tax=Agriterribacter sp. TaxID=2821509 RepID=UPI002C1ED3F5|nr:histidine kinase [Agriterribacter sp.]HRP55544.1 histidine kinase [Agriterribacter sp.]